MVKLKQCKQCLKMLPDTDEYFYRYASRSESSGTTSRYTICKKCVSLNNLVTRRFKKEEHTEEDKLFLEKVAKYYRHIKKFGGEPKGAYAKHLFSETYAKSRQNVYDVLEKDLLVAEYERLLKIELVDNPDIYQEMLYSVMDMSRGDDGRVSAKYRELFEQVAKRFDNYEDNYEWRGTK